MSVLLETVRLNQPRRIHVSEPKPQMILIGRTLWLLFEKDQQITGELFRLFSLHLGLFKREKRRVFVTV